MAGSPPARSVHKLVPNGRCYFRRIGRPRPLPHPPNRHPLQRPRANPRRKRHLGPHPAVTRHRLCTDGPRTARIPDRSAGWTLLEKAWSCPCPFDSRWPPRTRARRTRRGPMQSMPHRPEPEPSQFLGPGRRHSISGRSGSCSPNPARTGVRRRQSPCLHPRYTRPSRLHRSSRHRCPRLRRCPGQRRDPVRRFLSLHRWPERRRSASRRYPRTRRRTGCSRPAKSCHKPQPIRRTRGLPRLGETCVGSYVAVATATSKPPAVEACLPARTRSGPSWLRQKRPCSLRILMGRLTSEITGSHPGRRRLQSQVGIASKIAHAAHSTACSLLPPLVAAEGCAVLLVPPVRRSAMFWVARRPAGKARRGSIVNPM
jgi:hypothetical protein